tara:strand:+ start:2629 stop:2748 length:120 start_codon:yes stop_codon:yes gene_type:complete
MKSWEKKFDKGFDRLGELCEVYLISLVVITIVINVWRAI